jgi:hypothetical protein
LGVAMAKLQQAGKIKDLDALLTRCKHFANVRC